MGKHAAHWRFMGDLLPFGEQDAFTFLDLGAGTGTAARAILGLYPRSTAILTDFSAQMARHENHVRYMIPLAQQLDYLRSAGFAGIDVYWTHLENVIYGGCRPA